MRKKRISMVLFLWVFLDLIGFGVKGYLLVKFCEVGFIKFLYPLVVVVVVVVIAWFIWILHKIFFTTKDRNFD